jgi:hypothetical protein
MAQDISGSTPVIDPDLLHAVVIPIRTAHGDLVSEAAYESHLYVFPNLAYMTTIIPRRSGKQSRRRSPFKLPARIIRSVTQRGQILGLSEVLWFGTGA